MVIIPKLNLQLKILKKCIKIKMEWTNNKNIMNEYFLEFLNTEKSIKDV